METNRRRCKPDEDVRAGERDADSHPGGRHRWSYILDSTKRPAGCADDAPAEDHSPKTARTPKRILGPRVANLAEDHRTRLRAVAYRMLGSLSEADDAVQEPGCG
jgi:hypothetical protein